MVGQQRRSVAWELALVKDGVPYCREPDCNEELPAYGGKIFLHVAVHHKEAMRRWEGRKAYVEGLKQHGGTWDLTDVRDGDLLCCECGASIIADASYIICHYTSRHKEVLREWKAKAAPTTKSSAARAWRRLPEQATTSSTSKKGPVTKFSAGDLLLISAPGEKTPQETWDKLNRATGSLSSNHNFNIPDLKQITQIDNGLKAKVTTYNALKNNLASSGRTAALVFFISCCIVLYFFAS